MNKFHKLIRPSSLALKNSQKLKNAKMNQYTSQSISNNANLNMATQARLFSSFVKQDEDLATPMP